MTPFSAKWEVGANAKNDISHKYLENYSSKSIYTLIIYISLNTKSRRNLQIIQIIRISLHICHEIVISFNVSENSRPFFHDDVEIESINYRIVIESLHVHQSNDSHYKKVRILK